MGIVNLPSFGSDPATVTAAGLDGKVDPLATEFNGGIDNDNIASDAAIGNSKLNLAAIAQAVGMSGGLTLDTVGLTLTSVPANMAKGSDVASASAPNITSTTGNFVHITGTTTITSFATATAGIQRILVFDGILTFTHNSTSLILPTGANITTAAGDVAFMVSEGSGNWRCVAYLRKDGTALTSTTISQATQAAIEAETNENTYIPPDLIKHSPGVAKAWGKFAGTGTPAFSSRYNLDETITDNGTGSYTITFTTDFSDAHWVMASSGQQSASNAPPIVTIQHDFTIVAGSVTIETLEAASGDPTDFPVIYVVFYGDQA